MATLSIEYSNEQKETLEKTLAKNPGWTKALVVRAILAWFLELTPSEQDNLIKKYGSQTPTGI